MRAMKPETAMGRYVIGFATFIVSVTFSLMAKGGGYVPYCGDTTCAPQVQQATAILNPSNPSNILPTFNNATLTDKNTISETNNDLLKTPSSADPVSTVTGNNFHDETDFVIKGRAGLNYAFTRTYNSAPSSTGVDIGLGYGWVHSYGMRLTSNDYGNCPNCDAYSTVLNGGGRCLDVNLPQLTTDGGAVQIWHCNNQTQQQWQLTPAGELKSQGGKCLDVDASDYNANINGAKVQIWSCNGAANQQWHINPSTKALVAGNGKCLDADANNLSTDGDKVQLWDCNGTVQQSWGYSASGENGSGKTSSITYTDERGGDHNFLINEITFAVTSPQGEYDTLALDTPSTGLHTLTFRNGTKYIFEASSGSLKTTPGLHARLIQIVDPWGNQLNLNYDAGTGRLTSVTDNIGIASRTGLSFAYDASGHLSTITDWTGRTWTYAVDANGNLVSYTSPQPLQTQGAKTLTYGYALGPNGDVTHNLETITKPLKRDGKSVQTTFDYYQNGRTFKDYDGLGNTEALDYDLYRSVTRVTDPRGGVREYHYDSSGRLTQLNEADGAILQFQNQGDGLRYSKTDGLGYITKYSYRSDNSFNTASDTAGNVTLEQNALNQKVYTTYGPFDQVATVKDRRGSIITTTFYGATGTCAADGKPETVSIDKLTVDGVVKTNVPLKTYCWNADGTLKSLTETVDPENLTHTRVTTYFYTDSSDLFLDHVTATGWDGTSITHSFTFDTLGRKKTETLQRRTSPTNAATVALTTTYYYDQLDRAYKTVDPVGNIHTTIYDDNGKGWMEIASYKKPDNTYDVRTITRTYDAGGRLLTSTDTQGGITHYQYDESGNVTKVTDAENHVIRYQYDAMGRRTKVIDGNDATTVTTYNQRGEVTAITNPAGETTRFGYDEVGHRTSVTDAHGYVTTTSYDANGNVKCVIDANANAALQPKNSAGCTVATDYDELNRPIQVLDAINGVTKTTYDLLGHPLTQTDAEGRLYTWVYDGLGRLAAETDFTGHATTYQHDEAGNVWQTTNRLNEVKQTTFDNLNRPVLVSYLKDGTSETFGYDAAGNLSSSANGVVSYTMTYDSFNRLKSKTDSRGRSLSFIYDKVGNILQKTTYSGSVTTYNYDSANRLVNLTNPDFVSVFYQYDAAGRLLSRVLSSGAKSTYTYDGGGWLASLQHKDAAGATVYSQNYNRDHVGNIIGISDADGTSSYTLDALYRLTAVIAPTAANSEAFSYDHIGNRLTSTRGGSAIGATGSTTDYYAYAPATQTGVVTGYTPTYNNRLSEVHVGSLTGTLDAAFTYDDEGRLTQQTGSTPRTLTWDAKGRLATVAGYQYQYDPMNYRIRRENVGPTFDYFLEGEHLESIYSGTHETAKYFRGSSVDELVAGFIDQNGTSTPYFFQHDQVNSVVAVTKPNGGVQDKLSYWAFGETRSEIGASVGTQKYTGRDDDGTGLYYYRARYYDPAIGRFISPDPKKFSAGINFFVYVNDNPINANDPTGNIQQYWLPGAKTPSAIINDGKPFTKNYAQASSGNFMPVESGIKFSGYSSIIDKTTTLGFIDRAVSTHGGATFPGAGVVDLAFGGCCAYNYKVTLNKVYGGDALYNYNGTVYKADYIGNMIFGGIAQSKDVSLATAIWGSNVAQYISTGTPDDPRDPAAITVGYTRNKVEDLLNSTSPDSSNFLGILPTGSAAGGFLIYPNKPNNNGAQAVYSKGSL